MAEVRLSLPPDTEAVLDKRGAFSRAWRRYVEGVFRRLGGSTDNVFGALASALAAVPNTTEIVASGGLQFGGALGGNIPVALYVVKDVVANLPTSAGVGDWCYATNGRNSGEGAGSGTGCPVCWSGAAWRIPGVSTAVAA